MAKHMAKRPNEFANGKKPYSTSAVLDLRLNRRMSYRQIAKYYGKSVSTIYAKLKPFRSLDEGEEIEAFQIHKRNVLDAALLRALNLAFEPERTKKGSSGNFFYGARQLYEMSRLESDKSTANIGICAIVEEIEREGRERLALSADVPTEEKGEQGDG